jgi:alkanesulfonate monooxygenase SsuD/methylene tetrahydromethanopterin reductase-like flavin-dependent oxidoreductase (luciferase family)
VDTEGSRRTPQLSLGIGTFGAPPVGGWHDLLALARAADAAGIDRLVLPDHVVLGEHVDRYPWGTFPTGPQADWLEPLTLMSALAAVTDRVLAKTVATIDVLSRGRVDLGVGVGWQPEEFTALGVDFARRGELLDRTIADCRTLWSGEPLVVTAADGTPTPVWSAPVPHQPRLPVWFSGTLGRRNLARIVELGDGWIPIMGASADDVAEGAARLRDAFVHARRDPADLQVRASPPLVRHGDGPADPLATIEGGRALLAAGATDLHLPLRAFLPGGDPAAAPDALAALAAAFRTAVA